MLEVIQTWFNQHDPDAYRIAYLLIAAGVFVTMREALLRSADKRAARKNKEARGE
jgi:hypothetical protein